MLTFEHQAWQQGYLRPAGVDEAGRGPLAGPVVAAAVIIEPGFLCAYTSNGLSGVTDSKQLHAARREALYTFLMESPNAACGVSIVDAGHIDRINILRATHEAMAKALLQLNPPPDHALVDGNPVPGLCCPSTAIVKGDARCLSIAAASIVAKVTRDRMMIAYDKQYTGYGFARHKGYGTREHIAALRKKGPCPIHRHSFQPVRDWNRPLPVQTLLPIE